MRKEERLFVYCFNHIFHSLCKCINLQPGLYGVKKHQESTFTWLLSDNLKCLTSGHEGSGSTKYREELFMIERKEWAFG